MAWNQFFKNAKITKTWSTNFHSIRYSTSLGNNVKVQNNVAVYCGVTIEDDVFLSPCCVFTNVTNPRSQVSRKSLYEKTLVKRGATIGANATIVCGITLGQYCFIGAGAVVTKDIEPYSIFGGIPAKKIGSRKL